jgi:hypothetical protein
MLSQRAKCSVIARYEGSSASWNPDIVSSLKTTPQPHVTSAGLRSNTWIRASGKRFLRRMAE